MKHQPAINICPIKGLYKILNDGDHALSVGILRSSFPLDEAKLHGISFVYQQYDDVDREIPGVRCPRMPPFNSPASSRRSKMIQNTFPAAATAE